MTKDAVQPPLKVATRPLIAAGLSLLAASGTALAQETPSDASIPWVIDGHNDLPWVLRDRHGADLGDIDLEAGSEGDTDLPRLREGMVGAQFWSVFVPSTFTGLDAARIQLEQIDLARRMIERYDGLALALSADDIVKARAEGRIASLLGMEGGHTIVNSLGVLRAYHALGVRYMTLTHNNGHDWADSATDKARHGGLSAFGKEVVREMNRLGMLVDLSHVSPEAMHDALDVAEAPVIFSHSSAFAVTPHARNVPDAVLQRMAANGGVVMVTFIPPFVNEARRRWEEALEEPLKSVESEAQYRALMDAYRAEHGPPPRSTIADVADHIDHVAKVAGKAHVGIAADFYGAGGDEVTEGLEDVSRYPALFAELRTRGWSEDDLAALAHGNVLRVMREAERATERIRGQRPASLATIAMDQAASD